MITQASNNSAKMQVSTEAVSRQRNVLRHCTIKWSQRAVSWLTIEGTGRANGKTINQINEFFEWFDERRAL